MNGAPLPPAFVHLRDLLLIHLEKLLRVDEVTSRFPMHAVALVVMVGYEVLAKYTDPPPDTRRTRHWRFARYHAERYGLDVALGNLIFNALRNGLAHAYDQYPIPVDDLGEVHLVLTWKDGAPMHLRRVSGTLVGGQLKLGPAPGDLGAGPALVCVDVASLCADFEVVVAQVQSQLAADATARARFETLLGESRQTYSRNLSRNSDPAP